MKRYTDWKAKPLPKLIKYVQDEFCNPYIRERDRNNFGTCISSGGKIEHAGHFFSIGGHEGMRFNLQNIHGQSVYSNHFKSGDQLNYRKGLIARHGQAYVDDLEQQEAIYKRYGHKFTRFEVIGIGKTYKYLMENRIWVYTQNEFMKYFEKCV
jgi:hypothetical protein